MKFLYFIKDYFKRTTVIGIILGIIVGIALSNLIHCFLEYIF